MKRLILAVLLSSLLFLPGCGSGGSSSITSTPTSANTTINFGDATNDQVIGFEMLINSITLSGGSNPSVLPKPTEFEFVHAAGILEPLSLISVPSGTYTGATIGVANPEVVIMTASGPSKIPATLTASTVTVTFPSPITIGANAAVLNFDLNLATSITLNATNTAATVTPQFTATTASVPANNGGEDDEHGEMEDIRGAITNVSSPKFTIQPSQTAQPVTFTTNSSTQFKDGITSFSQLANGMIVSVDAVTQTDGTLLATKVESETETANGQEVEGFVTSVTGSPATQIVVSTQKSSVTSTTLGTSVTVSIGNGTKFAVQSRNLSGTLPAFDATHIGKAQRVEVDSETASNNAGTATGDKIKLTEQALTGTISALSGGNFTLTVGSTSAFATLTGGTAVAVQTQSGTEIKNVTLSNGATVRVRGLLFVNGTAYTMVAARIVQPE
ncbi:MAG: hypothetical protein DMG65_10395 [Candidatus Angelobacter sp. Gp1-AA117]|nr:MAG: hypothetical protein DMG65_10395 [Candidatus Angelobacter sp. Gp1-AA117]